MPQLEIGPNRALHYETLAASSPERPTLVFLHEGLGSIGQWKNFPAQLCAATGSGGLVFDRQGYGKSSPLEKLRSIHYLHDYALQELPVVLEHCLAGRDYIVIGHSDGGTIALLHAAEKPARLRGVITEAAHVSVEPEALAGIDRADAAYRAGKLASLTRYHGDQTDALFRAWADTWRAPWFAGWNIEYALPAIDCPVLVMQGERDEYGTVDQVDRIVRQSPAARACLIADCGHVPHHEQRESVLDAMARFIAERS